MTIYLKPTGITVADVTPLIRQAFEEVFEARLFDVPAAAGGGMDVDEGVERVLAEVAAAERAEEVLKAVGAGAAAVGF